MLRSWEKERDIAFSKYSPKLGNSPLKHLRGNDLLLKRTTKHMYLISFTCSVNNGKIAVLEKISNKLYFSSFTF